MRERIKKEPPKQSYQINQVKSNRIARNCQLEAYKLRPRLTELVQMGKIEIIGKKRDEITDRSTSIYQVIRGEENEQNTLEEDE